MRIWNFLPVLIAAQLNFGMAMAAQPAAAQASTPATKDTRLPRKAGDIPDSIEKAQGRIYCRQSSRSLQNLVMRTRKDLTRLPRPGWVKVGIGTATLAFAYDTAIVSRHVFARDGQKHPVDPHSCFFESIASGQLMPLDGVEYPPFLTSSDIAAGEDASFKAFGPIEQDFAVVHLKAPIPNMTPIDDKFILARFVSVLRKGDEIMIVANFADNYGKSSEAHYQPTVNKCAVNGLYRSFLKDYNGRSNIVTTDCVVGHGTSGSSVWTMVEGTWHWVGVVSEEVLAHPKGIDMRLANVNSVVTMFDVSVKNAYDKLRARFPVADKPMAK